MMLLQLGRALAYGVARSKFHPGFFQRTLSLTRVVGSLLERAFQARSRSALALCSRAELGPVGELSPQGALLVVCVCRVRGFSYHGSWRRQQPAAVGFSRAPLSRVLAAGSMLTMCVWLGSLLSRGTFRGEERRPRMLGKLTLARTVYYWLGLSSRAQGKGRFGVCVRKCVGVGC